MIVDLLRNDLSMVCEVGSVTVPSLMAVESYASVHQLVSTVRGRLRDDVSTLGALWALFPAGSMTGAPKLRTMQVIDDVEETPRGLYAGAFGWICADGRADLGVVIRSLYAAPDGSWWIGTGGGITVRSDVDEEWAETLWKAQRLQSSLPSDALDESLRPGPQAIAAPEVFEENHGWCRSRYATSCITENSSSSCARMSSGMSLASPARARFFAREGDGFGEGAVRTDGDGAADDLRACLVQCVHGLRHEGAEPLGVRELALDHLDEARIVGATVQEHRASSQSWKVTLALEALLHPLPPLALLGPGGVLCRGLARLEPYDGDELPVVGDAVCTAQPASCGGSEGVAPFITELVEPCRVAALTLDDLDEHRTPSPPREPPPAGRCGRDVTPRLRIRHRVVQTGPVMRGKGGSGTRRMPHQPDEWGRLASHLKKC